MVFIKWPSLTIPRSILRVDCEISPMLVFIVCGLYSPHRGLLVFQLPILGPVGPRNYTVFRPAEDALIISAAIVLLLNRWLGNGSPISNIVNILRHISLIR